MRSTGVAGLRGLGFKAVSALLVVGIMILASVAPLAQLARAQQGSTSASANATVTGQGYGIVVALNMSVNNVAALFKAWGVPSNSTFWVKLQEINSTIPKIEELVKQGKVDEARVEAAKLFQELGLLVAEAAKAYAQRVEKVNATTQRLVMELNRLAALERAVMASLTATLRHLEASLKWAEKRGAVCDNVTAKLAEMAKELNAALEKNKILLNKTLALRQAILAGSISEGQALSETKQLKKDVESFIQSASKLVSDARIAIAEPHACLAMHALRNMVQILKNRIANLTEEAKKLRQEGKTKAAEMLEKRAEALQEILKRYEVLLNKTRAEITRPHGLGEIIKIIKIRHMMPGIIMPIIKKFHIKPIIIMPITSMDRAIVELRMVTLELRAVSPLVPGNLTKQYNYVVSNLTNLISVLEAYRAGKVTKDEVVKAANQTLTALEEFKKSLEQLREETSPGRHGGEAATNTTTHTTSHEYQGNTSTTRSTSTTHTQHTSTTPHQSSTMTSTTTSRKRGGERGHSAIGLGVAGREAADRAGNRGYAGMGSWSPSIQARKISVLIHLVDKAEAIVKQILASMGYAPEKLSGIEAKRVEKSIAVAERVATAAKKLAKLTGNETLVKSIDKALSTLEEAKKAAAKNNLTEAKTYIEEALNETRQLINSIKPVDWVTAKIKMFLERVETILQTIILLMLNQ